MNLLLLHTLLLAFGWTKAQDRTYLLTAPKVLRLGAAERLVIQLFGYQQNSSSTFTVSLKSYPDKRRTFASESVTLNAGTRFQGVATLRLLPTDFPEEDSSVYLEARSSDFTTEEKILVSRDNGFLFIQTDKPLYTPEQSVKVRVFSLNSELKPARRPVTLTFMDPEAVKVNIVDLQDVTGVISMPNPFKIPLKPKPGVWKIEATYTSDYSTRATVEFEVKEYVLPSISIIIQPEANYISTATFETFKLKVLARYVHGTPVANAQVFLKFGYIDGQNTIVIPASLTREEMQNGEVEVTLFIQEVLKAHGEGPTSLQELDGKLLYVVVTVQETTGGISQEAELATVKFSRSPYTLGLIATPPFIKPGLPYFIRVQVRDPVGQPVSRVGVTARAFFTSEQEGEKRLDHSGSQDGQASQRDGTVLFIYNLPTDARTASFTLQTADQRLDAGSQATLSYSAEAYRSENGRYLYIDWASGYRELHVGDYATINVYFYHHPSLQIPYFSYQLVSKGQVVKFETIPRVGSASFQSINFAVTPDMVPSVRLLVYYIMKGEARAELVADSVWMDVRGQCIGNLKTELLLPDKQYRPKDNLPLKVKARQGSLVAFSSVDTAIYNLRAASHDPLTRALRHIEHSDQGCGGGGGRDNADVFRLAGLTFMTNANAKAIPPEDGT
ncbi:hypothetical protein MATL_G00056120 [Megalops atlanticus]|uniref:Alpha-2-macroglobulin bait region domain-containing protein n=1 Tax=Megalops atlanticus TaxID=7932 RepID=A0A9D3QAM4_MEGAT|nr:hypothetical protein MATL_G00056120 [Megalops atlanticus]